MYEDYNITEPYSGESYPQSIYHNLKTDELKIVGKKSLKRVDSDAKVTGKLKFGDDWCFPNQTYLKLKRSIYPHAKFTVDAASVAAAKKIPGVLDVILPEDVKGINVSNSYNAVIMQGEVFNQGDPVCAVVATEEAICDDAIEAIKINYTQLPFVLLADDAKEDKDKDGNPYAVHGDTNLAATYLQAGGKEERGDTAKGLAAVDKKIEKHYATETKKNTAIRDHAGIEPWVATTVWDNGDIVVYPSTQAPYTYVSTIASALKLPRSRVRCIMGGLGTGFGRKLQCYRESILAAWYTNKTHLPCRAFVEAEGMFNAGGKQCCQHHDIKIGVKNDGTITALVDESYAGVGTTVTGVTNNSISIFDYIWKTDNIKLVSKDYWTNMPYNQALRCVQHPIPTTFMGMAMDEAAEAINMNPADFLVKNMRDESGVGAHPSYPKYDMGTNAMPDMLKELIARSGFKNKWKGWKTPMAVDGSKRRGIGIGVHACHHGALSNPESANIQVLPDGSFRLSIGSMDQGTGSRTALMAMAAEELGITFDKIKMSQLDTAHVSESRTPGGSTVTRGSGTAAILAARDTKRQLFALAIATKLIDATDPSELEMANNEIYVKKDPSKKVAVATVCGKMQGTHGFGPIVGYGHYATARATLEHREWNCDVVEVEVDVDTGELKILKVWSDCDPGRAIFPDGAWSQFAGGQLLFLSLSSYEGIVKDLATGYSLNADYQNYKIATNCECPDWDLNLYECPDPYGPFGAKGICEPQSAAVSPAIANAIYNAIGVRLYTTPFTPENILEALGKA
ncbi:MAG: xanthine dehydrogenase family protein molybdopterin-binding subunit [Dehalococcoidales bacterium]|nr:xanthine dehydrogenase family protein molybdopterin-binding subunit [Dehalococcoidales bacterium]